MNKEQSQYYSKGYNAGKKIKASEIREVIKSARIEYKAKTEDQIYDQYFCAALNGLIASPDTWNIDGGVVKNVNDYVRLAIVAANSAMKHIRELR